MKKSFLLLTIVSLLAASCKKDDAKISEITLNAQVIGSNNTFQITDAEEGATFKTEDVNVATVSDKGLISAVRCGETNIDVTEGSATRTVKVTVTPVYNLCKWQSFKTMDASKEQTDAFVKEVTGGAGTLSNNILTYQVTDSKSAVSAYEFRYWNDKLSEYRVHFKTTTTPEDIIKFISERYNITFYPEITRAYSPDDFYNGKDKYGNWFEYTPSSNIFIIGVAD